MLKCSGQLESWIAPIIKDAKAVDQAPMRPEGLQARYMRKRLNRLKLFTREAQLTAASPAGISADWRGEVREIPGNVQ